MTSSSAELHKQRGNSFFQEHRYEDAIREYSTAIIQNPNVTVYYTNRAVCNLKLGRLMSVEQDCRRAIELDALAAKAHFLLGEALISQEGFETEAVTVLKKAYELATQQQLPFTKDVLSKLMSARKQRWDRKENARLAQEHDLFAYLQRLIRAEQARWLEKHQEEGVIDAIRAEHDLRIQQLEQVFAQSDENMKKREVPDYFCDKINFSVMHDPVITPSGITYERTELAGHMKHVGKFDPLSRKPLREEDIVPNLSLREAIEDFVSKNGWAADY